MLPHLVADDDQVMLARDRGDRFQLVGVEQPPGRIVRIVEDDRAGLRADRRLQRSRSIRQPGGCSATSRTTPRRGGSSAHSVIGRREDDHLVAGLDRRQDRRASASVAPLVTQTWSALEVEPVMPPVMRRDRLAQRRQPARRRILVRPLLQRPRRRVEDLVGQPKSGNPCPRLTAPCFAAASDMRSNTLVCICS
jgi:hypothetical protein